MSKRKIRDLTKRKERQALTKNMTNKQRQAWGNAGRPMTKRGKVVELREE